MSKRKKGFSLDKHMEVGELLKAQHEQIVTLLVEVSNAYPRTGKHSGPAIAQLNKMIQSLSIVRSNLEEELAKEHPGEWTTKVYYGPRTEEDPTVLERIQNAETAEHVAITIMKSTQLQLEACRRELEAQTKEVARVHGANARLRWEVWRERSLHLCAGAKHRCYEPTSEVLQDAGEGAYTI